MTAPLPLRVLIVDDEPLILQLLLRELGREGFDVATVESAEAALELLSTSSFDVIVADLRLPQMSGLELCELARRAYPMMLRILMSGVIDENTMRRAQYSDSIAWFIEKPWRNGEVGALLRTIASTHNI